MSELDEYLTFLKALADTNRLKIVGLLARQPHTVEQLAGLLGLGDSTVSHHLSKLSEAGLVTATAQSYYNFYRLDTDRLKTMAKKIGTVENFSTLVEDIGDLPTDKQPLDYDQKVIRNYLLPDGRLKTIPSQRKKLLVVLRHIVQDFEPGKHYTEKQVNEMLLRYHPDTASLRREMVGYGLMAREGGGGSYWRTDSKNSSQTED